MAAVAVAVVAYDLLAYRMFHWGNVPVRLGPAALACCLFVYLARDRLDAVGVRGRPLPSWRFWRNAVLAIAAIFGVFLACVLVVFLAIDYPIELGAPDSFDAVWQTVVEAPFLEETIYRWAFVTGIVALAPRWIAVVLSGATFAYLHFLYGNPGPDNFVGGYFFAWMYLRSGSILVPIAFHALGNGSLIVIKLIAAALTS
ncbi:MAG TPA: CPBP family intramembrane glutamic endopeptidase [Xanthomonadales bacterium]|nr:CPBP family intramembrane glutamic endopeptidase [Xanthomonadales bacterium]